MTRREQADSDDMSTSEGERIRERREYLGWNKSRFADEVGVDRNTLTAIEEGAGYQAATMAKILKGLNRLEVEAGLHAEPRQPEPPEVVELEISDAAGRVRFAAKGPITPELERLVANVVREMRAEQTDES